jgi:hypothetical protein
MLCACRHPGLWCSALNAASGCIAGGTGYRGGGGLGEGEVLAPHRRPAQPCAAGGRSPALGPASAPPPARVAGGRTGRWLWLWLFVVRWLWLAGWWWPCSPGPPQVPPPIPSSAGASNASNSRPTPKRISGGGGSGMAASHKQAKNNQTNKQAHAETTSRLSFLRST